mmetsp:Transcript_120074/g.209026  ORF Transcript_120074/g.209026 Transcript_120074/m.209026 type:complete len:407 (+) Transcript_120074:575-1795(+)
MTPHTSADLEWAPPALVSALRGGQRSEEFALNWGWGGHWAPLGLLLAGNDLPLLLPLDLLPLGHDDQCPVNDVCLEALAEELIVQAVVGGAVPHPQPAPDGGLHLPDLLRLIPVERQFLQPGGNGVHCGDAEQADGLLHVLPSGRRPEVHLREAFSDPDDGLQLADGDGDGPFVVAMCPVGDLIGVLLCLHVEILKGLFGIGVQPREALVFAIIDVRLEGVDVEQLVVPLLLQCLLLRRGYVARLVDVDDVLGKGHVTLRVPGIKDFEDEVETCQNCTLEVQLVLGGPQGVVGAETGVGSGQHGGPGVQDGRDACLGDGDGLLLHGLVDGHLVVAPHLVELVDAHDAPVCQHQGASLQVELALPVTDDGGGETGGAAALPGGVHPDGRHLVGVLQELALGGGGIPN